jgi:formate-dependent nitrite reductase cytochrome c552 subunit
MAQTDLAKMYPEVSEEGLACISCHQKNSPALLMEWGRSLHAGSGIGCLGCHGAEEGEPDAWLHQGQQVSALVTPKDCASCHDAEFEEFSRSHHAKAGIIINSLDNILATKVAGMPGNNADAVNGCWQCHGSIVKMKRDKDGEIVRVGPEKRPVYDSDTWPNSGMGRLNLDGSQGSCHACHSRHSFEAKIARSPENCGKCHMGPDHPQIEIYNESKHGIAFYANRDKMALDKDGEWVLGRDYSAAPTCATCHVSAYMTPDGKVMANTHDVGERISWTLRPAISKKQNLVVYTDDREVPEVGSTVKTVEKYVENETLKSKTVDREVAKIVRWTERRDAMKGACANCHNSSFTDNFYEQFDGLVNLYNDKFGIPSTNMINDLIADGVLRKNAPFEHEVQWVYWELWHHEGRRARHGASMMGPDYTHWHGMYEVSKHYYGKFLPAVIKAAAKKSPAMEEKYRGIIEELMTRDEHIWTKGLSPEEVEGLREAAKQRYNQD